MTIDLKEAIYQSLKKREGAVSLILRIQANAPKDALFVRPDHTLGMRVKAPAVDNKANERIVELFSKWLRVTKSSISIDNGIKSKNKTILFRGADYEELAEKIGAIILSD